uniref:Putative secreted protein n=1 Tax=Anopheles triannulatus TaxID=58253 RepID=A0A2M4B397_9DIPT
MRRWPVLSIPVATGIANAWFHPLVPRSALNYDIHARFTVPSAALAVVTPRRRIIWIVPWPIVMPTSSPFVVSSDDTATTGTTAYQQPLLVAQVGITIRVTDVPLVQGWAVPA